MARWRDLAAANEAAQLRQTHALIALLDPERPSSYVESVLRDLGNIRDHPEVVPAVADYLECDRRRYVEIAALRVLREHRDRRSIPVLVERLNCGRGAAETLAVRALAAINGQEAATALESAFAAATWPTRVEIVRGLGAMDDVAGIDALSRLIAGTSDPATLRLVVRSLRRNGGDPAAEALGSLLQAGAPDARKAARRGLSRVGTPAARSALERARAATTSRRERFLLALALRRSGGRPLSS